MKSSSDLRPITDRALTSVMDTLRPVLANAIALDLFAGQGRLGFRALDEGAAHVTFVEKDRKASAEIRERARKFETRVEVVVSDVFVFLATPKPKYDLVFADPPFRLWTLDFHRQLFSSVRQVLAAEAIFLVKQPKRVVVPLPTPEGFVLKKTSLFGESKLIYFQYGKANTNP